MAYYVQEQSQLLGLCVAVMIVQGLMGLMQEVTTLTGNHTR